MNEIKYSSQLEQLLKDEAEIAESLSVLHRLSYTRYNMFSSIVSIPIIVISSITGYMTAVRPGAITQLSHNPTESIVRHVFISQKFIQI